MERTRRNALILSILLVGASLSFVGCSLLVVPNAVPPVEEYKDLALAGSVLDIVSAETDDTVFLLYESRPAGSLFGNRKRWGDALVAALSKELAQRGATILPTAATRFTLGLPEISGRRYGYKTVGFRVKAVVTSTAGWSKSYVGGTSAVAGMTPQSIADRAANYTIADLVQAMLADPAFIAQIKGATP
jgi:hypothetical protein